MTYNCGFHCKNYKRISPKSFLTSKRNSSAHDISRTGMRVSAVNAEGALAVRYYRMVLSLSPSLRFKDPSLVKWDYFIVLIFK